MFVFILRSCGAGTSVEGLPFTILEISEQTLEAVHCPANAEKAARQHPQDAGTDLSHIKAVNARKPETDAQPGGDPAVLAGAVRLPDIHYFLSIPEFVYEGLMPLLARQPCLGLDAFPLDLLL